MQRVDEFMDKNTQDGSRYLINWLQNKIPTAENQQFKWQDHLSEFEAESDNQADKGFKKFLQIAVSRFEKQANYYTGAKKMFNEIIAELEQELEEETGEKVYRSHASAPETLMNNLKQEMQEEQINGAVQTGLMEDESSENSEESSES